MMFRKKEVKEKLLPGATGGVPRFFLLFPQRLGDYRGFGIAFTRTLEPPPLKGEVS